jgi:hypothetical protein
LPQPWQDLTQPVLWLASLLEPFLQYGPRRIRCEGEEVYAHRTRTSTPTR